MYLRKINSKLYTKEIYDNIMTMTSSDKFFKNYSDVCRFMLRRKFINIWKYMNYLDLLELEKPNSTELIRGYIITRQFDKIKDIPNELLDLYNNTINNPLEEIYL